MISISRADFNLCLKVFRKPCRPNRCEVVSFVSVLYGENLLCHSAEVWGAVVGIGRDACRILVRKPLEKFIG
jgi:hypothetical protein